MRFSSKKIQILLVILLIWVEYVCMTVAFGLADFL